MCPPATRAAPLPPDERRAAIVAAAIPLVRDHGAAVTTREIAEAAGIAEGTIFRVFPDKDAVIDAVVTSVLDPGPYVVELRRIAAKGSLEQILTDAVTAMRRRLERVWEIVWMLRIGPGGAEHPRYAPRSRPDMAEATATLASLLEPHGPELRVDPMEAARLFQLVTFASAHPAITDGRTLSTPEVVELLLHGIGATNSPRSGGVDEKTISARSAPGPDSFLGPDTGDVAPEPVSESIAQPVGAR